MTDPRGGGGACFSSMKKIAIKTLLQRRLHKFLPPPQPSLAAGSATGMPDRSLSLVHTNYQKNGTNTRKVRGILSVRKSGNHVVIDGDLQCSFNPLKPNVFQDFIDIVLSKTQRKNSDSDPQTVCDWTYQVVLHAQSQVLSADVPW